MNLKTALLLSALGTAGAANAVNLTTYSFENSPLSSTATSTGQTYSLASDGGLFAGTASGFHALATAVYSGPSGNGSTKSLSANTWSVGDYYQFTASTVGATGLGFSFDQTGSNTGPANFKVSYSTDGTNFNDFANYAVPVSTWNPTTAMTGFTQTFDLSSVAALNNKSTVYLRLVDTSTSSINGSTVASGGTGRVDNVFITGNVQATPEPASLAALGVGVLALLRRRRKA